MKKISTTIVAFLFAFCIFGVQANASSAPNQVLEDLSVESSIYDDWQDSIVLSSDTLKLFESDFGIDYWDITYELDKISPQVVNSICADSAKYNYDVVITADKAHIKLKREDIPEGDIDIISSNLTKGNNSISGLSRWNYMQLTGLDIKNYEKIIEVLDDDSFLRVSKIVKSNDGNTFSVMLETTNYIVMPGDTLSEIALKKLTNVDDLLRLNPQITNPDLIFVDEILKIR